MFPEYCRLMTIGQILSLPIVSVMYVFVCVCVCWTADGLWLFWHWWGELILSLGIVPVSLLCVGGAWVIRTCSGGLGLLFFFFFYCCINHSPVVSESYEWRLLSDLLVLDCFVSSPDGSTRAAASDSPLKGLSDYWSRPDGELSLLYCEVSDTSCSVWCVLLEQDECSSWSDGSLGSSAVSGTISNVAGVVTGVSDPTTLGTWCGTGSEVKS